MTAIGQQLGKNVCIAHLGFHAFTGSDSVNVVAGQGKSLAFKLSTGTKGIPAKFVSL